MKLQVCEWLAYVYVWKRVAQFASDIFIVIEHDDKQQYKTANSHITMVAQYIATIQKFVGSNFLFLKEISTVQKGCIK